MELKKPNPNKPCFKLFPDTLKDINAGRCPDCKMLIPKEAGGRLQFRDQLSRDEYSISGLCQQCQDEMFGKEQ